ncbi:MAG: nitrous oxide reductase accessory protein NosL [Deltaproteobacteria bacterium HGW-Deltaproteobacteria-19]|jgi:nitrous oxide reductase accessory protein NosL|nr:MAG: nitrous oxide reductase accessory protein NosL [Deltaproteobacteria bacterium HGW-Deltaproteobacteria-19]
MIPVSGTGRKAARVIGTIGLLCILCFPLLRTPAAAGEAGVPGPSARDKCPVCGMFVSKYPDWTAVVLFRDGSRVYFDGAKDMFKYLFDMKRYDPRRDPGSIRSILVTDYYRITWTDARKAWYVLGSDVYGPMGRELIPLEKETDAREFLNDHKGKRILRFPGITREVVLGLDE